MSQNRYHRDTGRYHPVPWQKCDQIENGIKKYFGNFEKFQFLKIFQSIFENDFRFFKIFLKIFDGIDFVTSVTSRLRFQLWVDPPNHIYTPGLLMPVWTDVLTIA